MQSCFLFSPVRPHSAIVTQFANAIRTIFAQRNHIFPALTDPDQWSVAFTAP